MRHGPLRGLTVVRVAGRDLGCRGCRCARRLSVPLQSWEKSSSSARSCAKRFHCVPGKCLRTCNTSRMLRSWNFHRAWSPFAGLISDSILGRTKTFLPHLEGLFRTLPLKTPGKERDPLDAVLLLCLDRQNFTEDDFLTSLCERCVHGMSSRRRSAPPVFVDMDQDDETLPFHPLPVEDAEDLNVPWTLHSAMIRHNRIVVPVGILDFHSDVDRMVRNALSVPYFL